MPAWERPKFWLNVFTRFECHGCTGVAGYLSRPRTFFERHLLPLLLLRSVRCGDCSRRSWRPLTVPLLRRRTSLEGSQQPQSLAIDGAERG